MILERRSAMLSGRGWSMASKHCDIWCRGAIANGRTRFGDFIRSDALAAFDA
jgi:hypothetical protein